MSAATGPKTTSVDVSAQIERKLAALREHVTQLAADHFFLALSADDWRQFMPNEDFTLSESRVPVRIPEDDLFAGLPAGGLTDAGGRLADEPSRRGPRLPVADSASRRS